MAKLQTVDDDGHSTGHRTSSEFLKKDGIKYCNTCGKECLSEDTLCECGKSTFLSEKISSMLGGYINIAQNGGIRKYYNKNYNSESVIRMNPKRMIHQLLLHRNKIDIKKETVDKIFNANVTQQVGEQQD